MMSLNEKVLKIDYRPANFSKTKVDLLNPLAYAYSDKPIFTLN